jgi:hypothetical protein
MDKDMGNLKHWSKKAASCFLISVFLMLSVFPGNIAIYAADGTGSTYSGNSEWWAIINNISYDEEANGGAIPEAVYRAGALGILKSYGDKNFNINENLTKEEAIALALRMAGLEDEAQKAAEELDEERHKQDKKTHPVSMWSDGYLKIAVDEGLISEEDYEEAMDPSGQPLPPESFLRDAPAQRQEMAYWIAKALKLEPMYSQNIIFNGWQDWYLCDPVKVPYIEAVLSKGIMSIQDDGFFDPLGPVTWKDAAEAVKKAEDIILRLNGMKKNSGFIESIMEHVNYLEKPLVYRTFKIRNKEGKSVTITVIKSLAKGAEGATGNTENLQGETGLSEENETAGEGELSASPVQDEISNQTELSGQTEISGQNMVPGQDAATGGEFSISSEENKPSEQDGHPGQEEANGGRGFYIEEEDDELSGQGDNSGQDDSSDLNEFPGQNETTGDNGLLEQNTASGQSDLPVQNELPGQSAVPGQNEPLVQNEISGQNESPQQAESPEQNESNEDMVTSIQFDYSDQDDLLSQKNLVVFKDGIIGDSSLLEVNDVIEYIVKGSSALYAKVTEKAKEEQFIAQITSIDKDNLTMNLKILGLPEKSQTVYVMPEDASFLSSINEEVFRFSQDFIYDTGYRFASADELNEGDIVLLRKKQEMIVGAKRMELKDKVGHEVVCGIVEENNPGFGFITLYREDGWGTSPENAEVLTMTRTYAYGKPEETDVYANHSKASAYDIESGDTVFIKLDARGDIIGISAVNNHVTKYGTVINSGKNYLTVEYDDGTQQVLNINSNVKYYLSGVQVEADSLKDGDRIKLILNEGSKSTAIKEIHIEDDRFLISNVYKGTLSYIDFISDKLVLRNLEVLENGDWRLVDQKGFTGIQITGDCRIFHAGRPISRDQANKDLKGFEAYVAVRKGYGGIENAVVVSFRNSKNSEIIYDDLIAGVGEKEVRLMNTSNNLAINNGSILIKNGRLVFPGSINSMDVAYVVANRDLVTGGYSADVVEIKERFGIKMLKIYRGRISDITVNRSVTLESWSEFNDLKWTYYNTPKTFSLTYDTKILGDNGTINNRNFIDFGPNSYKGQTIYIVSKDEEALLISTAPYGVQYSRGEIYGLSRTGGSITGFVLKDAADFNIETYLWSNSADIQASILNNSIILKNDEIINPSDLKIGDKVGILRKETGTAGDVYLVIVQ